MNQTILKRIQMIMSPFPMFMYSIVQLLKILILTIIKNSTPLMYIAGGLCIVNGRIGPDIPTHTSALEALVW